MRCPRCGNENPGENRFCGMCGATLLAPAPIPPKPQPVSVPPLGPTPIRGEAAPLASPEPPRAPAATEDSPSISGPSFLGLNNPPPRSPVSRSRASLSIDPSHAPSSRSLDYLLEDDDESRSSGAWKYLLILIALGLAVGFGYLRWKNQGLPWLNVLAKKPAATTPTAPDATSSRGAPETLPASSTPSITPEPQAVPVQQQPAGTAQNPANSSAAPSTAPTTPPANPPAAGSTPSSTPAADDNSKPNDSGNAAASPEKGATVPAKDSAAVKATPNDSGDSTDEDTSPAPAKPAPKPKPTVPAVDPVSEAQKYLYGRGGVSQDCDRGMRLLKPAANQGNPKAMVEMGALYSAGLCTPHDLPTAYRWFAMALRKQPDNASIQTDLQKLWSEMTQPERQLAIKLSQ